MFVKKSESSGDYTPAPEGAHAGICTQVIDLGEQETTYGPKRQVRLVFEIDEKMQDGRPFTVAAKMTVSMNEKAALYKLLSGWFGRGAIDEALKRDGGFDVAKVLGQAAMVNVSHSTSATDPTRTYANIASLARLPKGMAKPAPVGPLLHFDCDAPDNAVLTQLPEWLGDLVTTGMHRMRDKARSAPAAGRAAASAPAMAGGGHDDDLDSEIPF